MRNLMLRLSVALASLFAASAAFAQAYPSRTVTMIVPYAAGGNVDAVARWVGEALAKRLGQTIIIDNVVGAGGVVGTDRAAHAMPDGYTLLLSVESTMAIAKLVSPSIVKYDGQKDFAPITLISSAPLVLVGKPAFPANNLDELLALLRANPGKFNYATSGVGTSLHVAGEMINQQGKVQMVHVPYKVMPQLIGELMGNQVDLAVLPVPLVAQQVKAGKLKAYGVTEAKRSFAFPDVPSMAEHADLKDVDVTVWFGTFAPAKTDPAIVARLHRETIEVLKQPDIQQRLADFGMRMSGAGPAEFAVFLAREVAKFSAIVKAANIRAE